MIEGIAIASFVWVCLIFYILIKSASAFMDERNRIMGEIFMRVPKEHHNLIKVIIYEIEPENVLNMREKK